MSTPSKTSRKLLPIAASAAIVIGGIGLSACGGDDETSPTTASGPLSASELASEADALCTEANEELAARDDVPDFGDDGLQSDELEQASPYFEASAEIQQGLFDDLSALEPDEAVSDDWGAFLESYEVTSVTVAEELASEAANGDQEAFFQIALDNQKSVQELAAQASELGMTTCGASDAQSVT